MQAKQMFEPKPIQYLKVKKKKKRRWVNAKVDETKNSLINTVDEEHPRQREVVS